MCVRKKPRRSSPARARTIASQLFCASFRNRVGTLPRRSMTLRSARCQCSWCFLRTLPVATMAAPGRQSRPRRCLDTSTSSIGARGRTAAILAPKLGSLGRSFALWTATSISSVRRALSMFAVNNPFRPAHGSTIFASSPLVAIILISIATSECPLRITFSTNRLCARASSLPRVPRMIFEAAMAPSVAAVCDRR